MIQKLHILTLGVVNLARAVEFYENGLGWKRSDKSTGDMVIYPLGGIALAIYPVGALAEDVTLPYERPGFAGVTLSYNAADRHEVDRVMALAARAGGKIVKPAQDVFWGGYSGYFQDPDGHVFEVAYNPFWGFDENGDLIL